MEWLFPYLIRKVHLIPKSCTRICEYRRIEGSSLYYYWHYNIKSSTQSEILSPMKPILIIYGFVAFSITLIIRSYTGDNG
uniref:Uncharacterized protein n=1 Tax=Parascaris univalens TaxID=6257 RepID=A0A915BEP9_PARUN